MSSVYYEGYQRQVELRPCDYAGMKVLRPYLQRKYYKALGGDLAEFMPLPLLKHGKAAIRAICVACLHSRRSRYLLCALPHFTSMTRQRKSVPIVPVILSGAKDDQHADPLLAHGP
jgi:hypothetical protein